MVGRTIATDLAQVYEVTSVDISKTALDTVQNKNKSITTIQYDLGNTDGYAQLLTPFDFIVTAVPGFMGYKTLEAVIASGKNVADISFFPEDAFALDELAKKKNVTAFVDCGVAPGMSNLILGYYDSIMEVTRFECMVGGLPVKRIKPFEYKAPFSPADVIEEYLRPARFVEDGKIVIKPALSDPELISFNNITSAGKEVGTLESFNTDGLRSILFTMKHIRNMKEKTLRYPGHISLIKAFIEAGFFDENKIHIQGCEISPLDFSSRLLFKQWKLGEEEPEFTIMRIIISGNKKGQHQTIEYNLYDEYDPVTKTSSMARTTGYTCTATVNLLLKNLFNEKGIFPPELIGKNEKCFSFIMEYLQKRNIVYNVSKP